MQLHEIMSITARPASKGVKRLLLRGCVPVTPYTAGFEDTRYAGQYLNPFPLGSASWLDYEAGNQDARRKAVLL